MNGKGIGIDRRGNREHGRRKNERQKMYGKCWSVMKWSLRDREWTRLVGVMVVKMIDQLRSITKFSS